MSSVERELREALAAMTLRAETAEAYLQQTENELAETKADLKFLQDTVQKQADSKDGNNLPTPDKNISFQEKARKAFESTPPSIADIDRQILDAILGKNEKWEEIMRELIPPSWKTRMTMGVDTGIPMQPRNVHVLRMRYDAMKDCLVCTILRNGDPIIGVDIPHHIDEGQAARELAGELIKAGVTSVPRPEVVRRLGNAFAEARLQRGMKGDYNVAL